MLELRLCGALGMTPARLRRQPLALVWLWFNAACQESGLETVWQSAEASREERESLHARLEAMRRDDAPQEGQS